MNLKIKNKERFGYAVIALLSEYDLDSVDSTYFGHGRRIVDKFEYALKVCELDDAPLPNILIDYKRLRRKFVVE